MNGGVWISSQIEAWCGSKCIAVGCGSFGIQRATQERGSPVVKNLPAVIVLRGSGRRRQQ
jgi:hypothetical protein